MGSFRWIFHYRDISLLWFRLEHLQSFIDLRQPGARPRLCRRSSDLKLPARIVINVSGTRFETFQSTLERYSETLLGNSQRRALFYDKNHGEYFFDRHRSCFDAILYYYQSHGRLRRPDQVPLDTFLEEIKFFDLGPEALAQVRHDEELEEAHKVPLPTSRCFRHLWANLEYPQYSLTAKIINIVSMIFILISAVELAVETLPKYRGSHDKRCELDGDGRYSFEVTFSKFFKMMMKIIRSRCPCCFPLRNTLTYISNGILGLLTNTNSTSNDRMCSPNFRSPFFIIQSICIGFFTIEFLLRLISCPSFLNFIRSFLNWIDFLAIGKSSLSLIVSMKFYRYSSTIFHHSFDRSVGFIRSIIITNILCIEYSKIISFCSCI